MTKIVPMATFIKYLTSCNPVFSLQSRNGPKLEHSDSRFESIRFESIRFLQKSERPIRLYWLLKSVCQTTDLRRITAGDTHILQVIEHAVVPYTPRTWPQPGRTPHPPSSLPPSALRRIESDESIRIDFLAWIEWNRNYFWRIGMLSEWQSPMLYLVCR